MFYPSSKSREKDTRRQREEEEEEKEMRRHLRANEAPSLHECPGLFGFCRTMRLINNLVNVNTCYGLHAGYIILTSESLSCDIARTSLHPFSALLFPIDRKTKLEVSVSSCRKKTGTPSLTIVTKLVDDFSVRNYTRPIDRPTVPRLASKA